jgi:UDP-glucuronate 4-epimerase
LKTLITGAAGFIGMNCALRLLDRGDEVIGIDNLNDYYDVSLKQARLARLEPHAKFGFHKLTSATAMPCLICLLCISLIVSFISPRKLVCVIH